MAKKSKPEQKEECLLPFPDIEFYNKWQEWLKYRKERRIAAYTATGLNRTFDMLKEISGNDVNIAILIIDQSICQNWQGLFALKNQSYGTATKSGTGGGKIDPNKVLRKLNERFGNQQQNSH